jgi:hypothetical protein
MKKNVFFLFLLFSLASFAQGEANVWYFGENAGASLTGGNFWEGAATGLAVSGLNHLAHNVIPKKYNIATLVNYDAAGKFGHEAIAFEQKNGTYNYASKDGGEHHAVGDADYSIVENLSDLNEVNAYYNKKTGKSFDEVAIYKATRAQITRGWNFAKEAVKTYYSVIGNSCTTLVTSSMAVTYQSVKFVFEGSVPRVNFHSRQFIYSEYYSHSFKF